MAIEQSGHKHDPRALDRYLFERAKVWFVLSNCSKVVGFVVTVFAVFVPFLSGQTPYIVALLAILSEVCLWRSDTIKGLAESLLRKLDMRDSLGWKISSAEMSDLLVQMSTKVRRRFPIEAAGEQYFASTQATGSHRAVENIQESAWWSKHLTSTAWQICFGMSCLLTVGAIFLLITSIQIATNTSTLSNVSRVVTVMLSFIFTFGLFRLSVSYYRFNKRTSQIEEQASIMLETPLDKEQAIKLIHEYQLARASAPLLPSWIWKLRNSVLNEMWQEYRTSKSS